MSFKSRF